MMTIKSLHFQVSKLINQFARALGFEPRSKVLETRMLPLHHARKKALPISQREVFLGFNYLKNSFKKQST